MGGYLGGTISVERMDGFARTGTATSVADWVVMLKLAPEALVLYMRMCHIAENEDPARTRVTLTPEEADTLAQGDGRAALKELLKVGAVTKVAAYKSGKTRFEIQDFPPTTRAEMAQYRHEGGLPVLTLG